MADLTPEERAEVQRIIDEALNSAKGRIFAATEKTFAIALFVGFPERTMHSTNLDAASRLMTWLRRLFDKWEGH